MHYWCWWRWWSSWNLLIGSKSGRFHWIDLNFNHSNNSLFCSSGKSDTLFRWRVTNILSWVLFLCTLARHRCCNFIICKLFKRFTSCLSHFVNFILKSYFKTANKNCIINENFVIIRSDLSKMSNKPDLDD